MHAGIIFIKKSRILKNIAYLVSLQFCKSFESIKKEQYENFLKKNKEYQKNQQALFMIREQFEFKEANTIQAFIDALPYLPDKKISNFVHTNF